jgi:hypothetical protein
MNSAAHYTVGWTSNGYELVLELGNGEAELIGYYPTRKEANEVRAALRSLRGRK